MWPWHQRAAPLKREVEIIAWVAPEAGSTKVHSLVEAQGRPVRLGLTAGQANDAPAALALLDHLAPRTIVLGDKAYDANGIRDLIEAKGAVPNIPAKSNRK